MSQAFPNLFSSIKLGNCDIKNRIVSTGHHTYLADREPNDALIAYHADRAKGGAGLIVSEIVAVHETAAFSGQLLTIDDNTDVDAYRRLADAELCELSELDVVRHFTALVPSKRGS